MVQELREPSTQTPVATPPSHRTVILKFLGIWISSLVALVVVALLTNIEWARPRLESALSDSFHRKVSLGRLSWTLGFNGLSIETNRFTVAERTGSPFISSGPSEIGVAFLPLFEKRVIVKHLQFKKPEVWAVKLPDGTWNYSDLLTEGPEIHLLQIDKGTLHLRNADAKESWRSYDLEDVKLKFVFPRKDKDRWPVYFACRIPVTHAGKSDNTLVRLSLTGRGPFESWRSRKYMLDLEVEGFDPGDFRPIFPRLPQIAGVLNFRLAGEGVYQDGFQTAISGSLKHLSLAPAAEALPDIQISGQVTLAPTEASWQNVSLLFSNWSVIAEGKATSWDSDDARFDTRLKGQFSDFDRFCDQILTKVTTGPRPVLPPLKRTAGLARAAVDLRISGSRKAPEVSAIIRANSVPITTLLESVRGKLPQEVSLSPDTPVSGEIEVAGNGERIALNGVEIQTGASKLSARGWLNTSSGESDLKVSAAALDLEAVAANIKHPELEKMRSRRGLPQGKLDLEAHVRTHLGRTSFTWKAEPRSMRLAAGNHVLSDITGRAEFDGSLLRVDGLSFKLRSPQGSQTSTVRASGAINQGSGEIDLRVEGTDLDIRQICDLLDDQGMPRPELPGELSGGRLNRLNVHLGGKMDAPSVRALSASPDELSLSLAARNQSRSLKLSGGSLVLSEGRLTLKDVTVATRSSKVVVDSAEIVGTPEDPHIEQINARTDGLDICDLQPFIHTAWYEEVSRAFPSSLTPQLSAPMHGKLYGDVQIIRSDAGPQVEAILGFNNVSGTFGKRGTFVEKLTGLVTLSPKFLLFQDITGLAARSSFAIDGAVENYQDPSCSSWSGQLKGRFFPGELARLKEILQAPLLVSSASTKSLPLRLSGSGTAKGFRLTASTRAEPGYGLRIASQGITLLQPVNSRLVLEGVISYDNDKQETELLNLLIAAGDEKVHAQGKFSERHLQATLATPQPVSVAALLALFDAKDVMRPSDGTVTVNLDFNGPRDRVMVHGSLATSDLTVPALSLAKLNGRLDITNWTLADLLSAKLSQPLDAKLSIVSMSLGELDFRNGEAEVTFVDKPSPMITITRGESQMAGGKVKLGGFFDPSSHRYQLSLTMDQLALSEFVEDLMARDGKVSGSADIQLTLEGTAHRFEEVIPNLNGQGKFNIYQGQVVSFGKLQEKLNGANLLQQGIFGFNINNLVQTMMPVKTGSFKEVNGTFKIKSGVIAFDHIHYDGDNLRMRAAGEIDLVDNSIALDVAGDIPRVVSSIIPGPIGEVSRNFTLQRLFRIATFRQLKDLPSLPLLGDIANDDPRSFVFKVAAPVDKPTTISQSVEKSFHWLPNKPFASAHPVPGMELSRSGLDVTKLDSSASKPENM